MRPTLNLSVVGRLKTLHRVIEKYSSSLAIKINKTLNMFKKNLEIKKNESMFVLTVFKIKSIGQGTRNVYLTLKICYKKCLQTMDILKITKIIALKKFQPIQ